jgi:hypothetical protein
VLLLLLLLLLLQVRLLPGQHQHLLLLHPVTDAVPDHGEWLSGLPSAISMNWRCLRACLLAARVQARCFAYYLTATTQLRPGMPARVASHCLSRLTCINTNNIHPNVTGQHHLLPAISLLQDCCGMGRAVEAGFDAAAFAWWVAGAITLGLRASEANSMGIPQQSARNSVVALCWLSAAMFLALLVTNLVLIKKLGEWGGAVLTM